MSLQSFLTSKPFARALIVLLVIYALTWFTAFPLNPLAQPTTFANLGTNPSPSLVVSGVIEPLLLLAFECLLAVMITIPLDLIWYKKIAGIVDLATFMVLFLGALLLTFSGFAVLFNPLFAGAFLFGIVYLMAWVLK